MFCFLSLSPDGYLMMIKIYIAVDSNNSTAQ